MAVPADEVVDALHEDRAPYTTVMTVMENLYRKGGCGGSGTAGPGGTSPPGPGPATLRR